MLIGTAIAPSAARPPGGGPAFVDLTLDNDTIAEDETGTVGNLVGVLPGSGCTIIAQSNGGWFGLEDVTSVIVGAGVDYETNDSPTITVRETNGAYTHDTVLTINVTDVAEVIDTGWVNPTSASDVAIGAGPTWTNPGNILASDDSRATITASTTLSHELRAGGFDFSSIPSGATITKLEVQYEVQRASGLGNITQVWLINGNAGSTADRLGSSQSGSAGTTTGADEILQCSRLIAGDLWGATLTPAIVQGANFGVAIRASTGFSSTAMQVDHIQMKISYTP